MKVIKVTHLKKDFTVYKKQPGVVSSFKSLFTRKPEIIPAISDISFEVSEGELVGFIGPNGAGKTTTLKCLSGLLYPSAGKLSVLNYFPYERKSTFLSRISLIMGQKNQLWWDLSAAETFKLNKEIYQLSDEAYAATLKELIKLLDAKDFINVPVRQLSLGQRMRMELIAALLHQPKILFLDEPTIGLDVVMQKKIRDFIAQYNKKYKATILLTSHYMSDVKKLCKRVIIIDLGRIIYDGSLEQLIKKTAGFKIIKVVFDNANINSNKLKTIGGSVRFFSGRKLELTATPQETKLIAMKILKSFPIEDMNIEDPELEEVIRLIFKTKHV